MVDIQQGFFSIFSIVVFLDIQYKQEQQKQSHLLFINIPNK